MLNTRLPSSPGERFDVVCGLWGLFHVVDRLQDGRGVARFDSWEDARAEADRLCKLCGPKPEREPGEEG
jgi:hypothetical protein